MSKHEVPVRFNPSDSDCEFPDVGRALAEPNGLLAIGGNLSPDCLIKAYRSGIFPWYSQGQPILWWSPTPRAVLYPSELKLSRNLTRTLRRKTYTVTFDTAFADVIRSCAEPRKDTDETWITPEMMDAYLQLHRLGYAHSAEAWLDDTLVGGLYGVAVGRIFCGESMFHREENASKVAFAYLVRQLQRWEFALIDCQVGSPFLRQLGAVDIDRAKFIAMLNQFGDIAPRLSSWQLESFDF